MTPQEKINNFDNLKLNSHRLRNFQKKFFDIKKLGINNLCIISDFDDTISKGIKSDGTKSSNSFSVYMNNPHLLGEKMNVELNKLFNYYYPIEQDPNLPKKQKEKIIVEWWNKTFEEYKKYKFSKDIITQIVDENLMELKDKTDIFLEFTVKHKIDTIIFSAGIYNLIHKFLDLHSIRHKNIHVVANKFKFDENGLFTHTYGDVIHSMNKTFFELSRIPVYEELTKKKTCIILGDSLSDTYMANGANFETILKIGFLNTLPEDENYQKRLKAHKEKFDLVLEGQEDFTKLNLILKQLLED
jgi:5'-nucleotidase